MKKLYISKIRKISQSRKELEKALDVKISINGRSVSIDGKEVNEYEWTVLKKYMLAEIQRLDKEFKKSLRKNKACVKASK